MQNRFNIGDRVVALNSTPSAVADRCQTRVKGQVYKVLDVVYCQACGSQSINVSNEPTDREMLMCNCRRSVMPTYGVRWTASEHFTTIDEALSKAIAEENYEYACTLRDAT